MARFDSAPPILSSRLPAWRRRPGRGGTPRTIVSPAVITSRFCTNCGISRASPLPVPGHYPTWRATLLMLIWSPSMIREGEVVGIGLIGRIDALEVGGRSLAFWGLGQVGVAIKGPTGGLYVDPYLTDSDGEGGSLPRTFPPPLAPAEVTNASAVLLTHVHIDHTDPDTVLPLSEASPDARFVAPFTRSDTLIEEGLDEKRIVVPEIGAPVEIARCRLRSDQRPRLLQNREGHHREHRLPRDRGARRDARYRPYGTHALRPDRRQHGRPRTLRQPPL